jgi:hypothetical protein
VRHQRALHLCGADPVPVHETTLAFVMIDSAGIEEGPSIPSEVRACAEHATKASKRCAITVGDGGRRGGTDPDTLMTSSTRPVIQ